MEAILVLGNKLVVNIFEIYIILRFIDIVLANKIHDRRVRLVLYITKLALTLLVDYYAPYVWLNFVVSLISVFLLTCCYRSGIWKKVSLAIGINFMLAGAEAVVALIIRSDKMSVLSQASNEQSIALALSRIVFWMVVFIVNQFKTETKEIKIPIKIWLFEGIVLFAIVAELILFCSQGQSNALQESLLLLGSEITIYLLIYLYDCLVSVFMGKLQTELIQKEKEYYHREATILQENQEITRQFRHDWKNRIQVMSQLVERRQWEELQKYLSEVENKIVGMQLYSNTGNLTIDSIINSKVYQAINKNIEMTVSVQLPENLEVDNDDMVVILGNLLDNAIEACEYVEEKNIELILRYEEGCIFLQVWNTFDEILNSRNGEYLTRKKDKSMHGIGIKSVKTTVEKYSGIMEVKNEKNKFRVDVMMYL